MMTSRMRWDVKLTALRRAAVRVAHVAGPLTLTKGGSIYSLRFTALWKARNRRTRVMMRREEKIRRDILPMRPLR